MGDEVLARPRGDMKDASGREEGAHAREYTRVPFPIIAAIAPADADEGGVRDHVTNRGEWACELAYR